MAAAWLCGHYKGSNLKVIDVRGKNSLADFFILASASNITQAQSLADEILFQLKQFDVRSLSCEGLEGADWILLDTGDVMVHIFQESARSVYDLDGLWSKYSTVAIPESYYHAEPEMVSASTMGSDEKGFF
jgi:ribosome-associated protein